MSIEPFRQEIETGVFLIGAPLGTNVFGFSFIKIRDANNQEIPTYTCYDPGFGKECPRLPHDISDETSFGWVICNGQEVVLKDGEVEKFSYTANPPPLRKIEEGTLRKHYKPENYFETMRQETEAYYKKSLQEHGGKLPTYEYRVSDAAPYIRTILGSGV